MTVLIEVQSFGILNSTQIFVLKKKIEIYDKKIVNTGL